MPKPIRLLIPAAAVALAACATTTTPAPSGAGQSPSVAAATASPSAAASASSAPVASPGGSAGASAAPSIAATIDPTNFVAVVDNPWYPLIPGYTWRYRGIKDGEPSIDVYTVTNKTKVIEGVTCVVVDDRLYLSGRLEEKTSDYYAQDRQGNVWYFGEDTAELDEHGNVTSREGTWRSGRDGAMAGIFMEATPVVGHAFRQEYYAGHAEDHFQVLDLDATITVPAGMYTGALLTREWTPLEPGVVDHKYYVKGIGEVREAAVKGPKETLSLLSFKRG
jgi:hypothetical protein